MPALKAMWPEDGRDGSARQSDSPKPSKAVLEAAGPPSAGRTVRKVNAPAGSTGRFDLCQRDDDFAVLTEPHPVSNDKVVICCNVEQVSVSSSHIADPAAIAP